MPPPERLHEVSERLDRLQSVADNPNAHPRTFEHVADHLLVELNIIHEQDFDILQRAAPDTWMSDDGLAGTRPFIVCGTDPDKGRNLRKQIRKF